MKDALDQTLLVDLDVLLDTRLGTILYNFPEASENIDKSTYRNRITDNFDEVLGLEEGTFKKAYDNRDVEVLKCSTITKYMLQLNTIVSDLLVNGINDPMRRTVNVEINYYPYKLEKDTLELIKDAISYYLNDAVDISMVSKHPMIITPSLLKSDYTLYVMYDLDLWLNLQMSALEETHIPDVTLQAPAKLIELPDEDKMRELGVRNYEDIFTNTEYTFTALVTLCLTEMELFSLL